MEVKLIAATPDAEVLCARAAQSTVSENPAHELSIEGKKAESIVSKVIKAGHHSVIEHASFTFSIKGISRACSHQLVRHRIASYSQQSQRYVELGDASYVTPPTIDGSAANEIFKQAMMGAFSSYQLLLKNNIPVEDARFVLPNATKTNIVVTMNARELLHFFSLRCCSRAQWEIRELANLMLAEARKATPTLFEKAGASCDSLRYCPESNGCGKRPMLTELLKNAYNGSS